MLETAGALECSTDDVKITELQAARANLNIAREIHTFTDVSAYVRSIQNLLLSGKVKLSDLGIKEEDLLKLKHEGLQSERVRLHRQIKNASQFGEGDVLVSRLQGLLIQESLTSQQKESGKEFLEKIGPKIIQSRKEQEAKCGQRKDYSKDLGPVRDQDGSGWCYAYVASDLLSHKLSKGGPTQKRMEISALDIHLQYHKDFFSTAKRFFNQDELSLTGGLVDGAIEAAVKRGLCLEKNFSSDDVALSNLAVIDAAKKGSSRFLQATCRPSLISKSKTIFGNISEREFQSIFVNGSRTQYLYTLADRACGKRIQVKTKLTARVMERSDYDIEALFGKLNERLDAGDVAAATFNGKVLSDHLEVPPAMLHAAVIAGKRWNPISSAMRIPGSNLSRFGRMRDELSPSIHSFQL